MHRVMDSVNLDNTSNVKKNENSSKNMFSLILGETLMS